jgi:hypothetical protein
MIWAFTRALFLVVKINNKKMNKNPPHMFKVIAVSMETLFRYRLLCVAGPV